MASCSPVTEEEKYYRSSSSSSPIIETIGRFPARELSTTISAAFTDENAANNIAEAAELHLNQRLRFTEDLPRARNACTSMPIRWTRNRVAPGRESGM